MTIKNPAYGIYPSDDDPADSNYYFDIADTRANVELQAFKNINGSLNEKYPASSGNFSIKMERDGTSTVVINNGQTKTVWRGTPGPCLTSRYNNLCDGYIPYCEPYKSITEQEKARGYTPRGCKAFHLCSNSWRKKSRKD